MITALLYNIFNLAGLYIAFAVVILQKLIGM